MKRSKPTEEIEQVVAAVEKRRGLSWRGLAQAAIGIGALLFVIVKTDIRGLADAFTATRISLLPLAVVATFAMHWLMAWRWRLILGVRGYRVKTLRLFAYYLIGVFFSNFIPGGAVSGDVARLIYASRDVDDRPFLLSTMVYERLIGIFVLLLIGLGATLGSRIYRPDSAFFYVAEVVLALLFLASAMLMNAYASQQLIRLCRAVGDRIGMRRIADAASRTIEAITSLRQHTAMFFITLIISIAIRLVWSLGCYVVGQAMELPVSLLMIFAFISLVDLLRTLPISVGGIGVREWAIIVLFANVGISREKALLFSLLAFAPVILAAIIGGVIYIARASVRQVNDTPTEGLAKRAGA